MNDITGGSFTALTVKVKASTAVKPPLSVTVIVRFTTPFAFATGVIVTVQFGAVPLKTIFATGTRPAFDVVADIEVEQFKTESTSVIEKTIGKGVSSFVLGDPTVLMTGASFTAVTVTAKGEVAVSAPSVTVSVSESAPFAFNNGVMAAVQFGAVPVMTTFAAGIIEALVEEALTEPAHVKMLSTSVIVKFTANGVSSAVVCAPIAEITGASFTAVTVTLKLLVTASTPSETESVRLNAPNALAAGVMVAVQFGAVPLKITLPAGIIAALVVEALIEPAQVSTLSTSLIVKFTENGVSSKVVCAEIAEITGGSLTAATVRLKLRAAESAPSLTVNVRFKSPLAFVPGFTVAVQFGAVPPKTIPASGTMDASEVAAVTDVEQFITLSTSVIVKLIVSGVSSAVVCAPIKLITGGSFTAATVTLNELSTFKTPSVTVKSRFATPNASAEGVIVAVQFGAVPLKTIPASEMTEALLVAALIEPAQVRVLSTSEIVKLTVNDVSSRVLCAPIALITGGSLTAVTVKLKLRAAVSAPSLTVKVRFKNPFAFATAVTVAVQFGAVPPK